MADAAPETGKLSGFTPILKFFAIVAGILGLGLLVDQGKVAKKAAPIGKAGAKSLWGLLKEGGIAAWHQAHNWIEEKGPAFLRYLLLQFAVTFGIMAFAVVTAQWAQKPGAGQVIAAIGLLRLYVQILGLYILSLPLARVLTLLLGVVDGIASKLAAKAGASADQIAPDELKRLEEGALSVREYLMAFLAVLSALFLPFLYIVSWKALFLAVFIAAVGMPAVFSILYARSKPGPIITTIKWVSIVLVVVTLCDFVFAVFMPRSFGTASLSNADSWLGGFSNWLWTIILIGMALFLILLTALFAEDDKVKTRRLAALKALATLSAIAVGLILVFKFQEVTGRAAPWQKSPSAEATAQADEDQAADEVASGQGTYTPAPRGVLPPSATPPAASTGGAQRRAVRKPLPPKPADQDFTNDPGAAIRAFDELGN